MSTAPPDPKCPSKDGFTMDSLSYKGFLMKGMQTERWNQKIRYTEAEELFSTYDITVSGLVHIDWYHFANLVGLEVAEFGRAVSVGERMRRLQGWMMHPRGALSYWSGSEQILAITGEFDSLGSLPRDAVLDTDNGPKPISFEISEVYNGVVFRVRFSVSASAPICEGRLQGSIKTGEDTSTPVILPTSSDPTWGAPEDPDPDPSDQLKGTTVVNHSWSYTTGKNERFYTTKTLDGVLRVKHLSWWPHAFRYLVVPALPPGYQRVSQRFTQAKDKHSLSYTVNDVQQWAAPPEPAVAWKARHSETVVGPGTASTMSTVHVSLQGAPGTWKPALIKLALDIVEDRIPRFRPTKGYGETPEPVKATNVLHSAQFIDHLDQNSIEVIVTVNRFLSSDEQDKETVINTILGVATSRLGEPLNNNIYKPPDPETGIKPPVEEGDKIYDRHVWVEPGLYDAADPIGIWANYIQSPCNYVHGIVKPVKLADYSPSIPRPTDDDRLYGPPTHVWHDRPPLSRIPAEIFYETNLPLDPERYDKKGGSDLKYTGNVLDPTTGYQASPITYIELQSTYEVDDGVLVLPKATSNGGVQQSTQTVGMFPWHSGVSYRVQKVTAERRGAWPTLPKYDKTVRDINTIQERLASEKTILEQPRTTADNIVPIYRAHQMLVFSMSRPPIAQDKLRAPQDPGLKQVEPNAPWQWDITANTDDKMFGGNIT